MKHICISDTNSSGYVGRDGHLFLNVEKKPQDPLLRFAPIPSHYPLYVLEKTWVEKIHAAIRFPDHSLHVKEHYIDEVYGFTAAENQKVQALVDRVEELKNTPSESVEVADPVGFQHWLDEVRATKDQLDDYLEYFDYMKLKMYAATGNSSGISSITKVSIAPGSFLFNESLARQNYEEEFFECCDEVLGERFEVNHTRRFEYQARHYEAPALESIGAEKDPDSTVERLHKEYWNEMRKYELQLDRHGIELLNFKIAIGAARNVPLCYTWVREPTLKFNREKFRETYPALYEACRVKKEPKWKCEILPFRG
jgi:hypothetical protein